MSLTAWFELIASGLITGGIYALVALGLNLQYGLMRILNIAHGEFLVLGVHLVHELRLPICVKNGDHACVEAHTGVVAAAWVKGWPGTPCSLQSVLDGQA